MSESQAADVSWLSRSRFSSGAARSKQVQADLEALLLNSDDATAISDDLDKRGLSILAALIAPLTADPPEASQAAEAALTLAQFSLTERRVLNIVEPSAGDLAQNGRLVSDRAVGDYLCKTVLASRSIPSTQGPFQSSSFRSNYLAAQARSSAVRDFAVWQSEQERTLAEVQAVAVGIADAMLAASSTIPPLPTIAASRLSFTAYRRARDMLLAEGSGGALEQYLLAGLLEQELRQTSSSLRVVTKNVGANDRATRAAGDIEIRDKQALTAAIEVSAAGWSAKVPQLEAAATANLKEITIAARGLNGVNGEELSRILDPVAARLGIDPAVVDLDAMLDVIAARLTPHGRAAAFTYVYSCLLRYHSRRPELAIRLIESLHSFDLLVTGDAAEETPSSETGLDDLVQELVNKVMQSGSSAAVAVDLVRSAVDEIEQNPQERHNN